MSATQPTTDTNAEFMRAAMTWLRVLLGAPGTSTERAIVDPVHVPTGRSSGWWRRRFGQPLERPVVVVPSRTTRRDLNALRTARRDLDAAMAALPAPRFTQFCETFDLLPFERDVLLLCLGHAVSTEVARLCAAMPEGAGGGPTFALALSLADDRVWDAMPTDEQDRTTRIAANPAWDALGPDRPLRYWRMIEITQPGSQPLVSSPFRADERIVNHLMGRDYVDDRIAPLCEQMIPNLERDRLSESQRSQVQNAIDRLQILSQNRERLLVQMPGSDSATKRLHAGRIVHSFHLDFHEVRLDQVAQPVNLATFVRLWNREELMQDVALYVNATDATGESAASLGRLLDGLRGLVFLDYPDPLPDHDTALLLDVARPTAVEQHETWQSLLADGPAEWPDRLAGQFNLNLGDFSAAITMLGDDDLNPAMAGARIWETYRGRARPRLDGLAQRIVSETQLDDVQLPENEKRLLEQVRDQARHRVEVYDTYGFRPRLTRGLGITALLAGESGTGKTMAAEAIANALELDLYRIDLASVVSKYIGETEKNLRQVFDAAEQSGAVLLFDEADAIFGKRSEVQDSHDRYANIEVSYLLQRMEAYEGLAILTTNMKSALDPAFMRRLRFIISFPFPGVEQRERIWAGIFPEGVQGVDQLDLQKLARPNLTGGQIRNIAVNAAFLAAAQDGVVTMEQLREAARDELRKRGKPLSAADFAGWETSRLQLSETLEPV